MGLRHVRKPTRHFAFFATINFVALYPNTGEIRHLLEEIVVSRRNGQVKCRSKEGLAVIAGEEPVVRH